MDDLRETAMYLRGEHFLPMNNVVPLVKRQGLDTLLGFAELQDPCHVFLGNMYEVDFGKLAGLPSIMYNSVEEVVEDGWVIN